MFLFCVEVYLGSNELGEDEGAWFALKGSKSRRNRNLFSVFV